MTDARWKAKVNLIQLFPIVTFFGDTDKVEIKAYLHDARPIIVVDLNDDDAAIITTAYTNSFTIEQIEAVLAYARVIDPAMDPVISAMLAREEPH